MEVRYLADQVRYQTMTTAELRQSFMLENLFAPGKTELVYSDLDRAIIGSAVPATKELTLEASKQEMAATYFAERREIGLINIGAAGRVKVDGKDYTLENRDGLYIGRSSQKIIFSSNDAQKPARFYLLSYPAHSSYPTTLIKMADAKQVPLGSPEEANQRIIYQYIHVNGVKSCQLVMGFTQLAVGSIWNTMSTHTHQRRTEIYMYFDLAAKDVVFHFMGKPEATRHVVMRDSQVVLSPSWSIHSGVGTRNYAFIWGMGGENQEFTDMDGVEMEKLK
jgi:4-deoxy-L-threo-5-hexosulose-uronate ketol-isomerase